MVALAFLQAQSRHEISLLPSPSHPPSLALCIRRVPLPSDVITPAVRWYLRFGLSYRDVAELLAEHGIEVDHVTIFRWVQRFSPEFAEARWPCGSLRNSRTRINVAELVDGSGPSEHFASPPPIG